METRKKLVRYAKKGRNKILELFCLLKYLRTKRNSLTLYNNTESIYSTVGRFIKSLQVQNTCYLYRYSQCCKQPVLYASVYACMTKGLLGDMVLLKSDERSQWVAYFNSFQSKQDGLFYDPILRNDFYSDTDWWGARHLALHLISAFTQLGGKPRYPFHFLQKYYDHRQIKDWLDSFDWETPFTDSNDIDNKIMNIGCLLQYQRDVWEDEQAALAVTYLQKYLINKINPKTGMWGHFDIFDPLQRSRMVQFAYHLFPLFFYDKIPVNQPDQIVRIVLATQNKLGGFGVRLNSSACEDIDSIDILIRLAQYAPNYKPEIDAALGKAWKWVFCNQVKDGGFVFRQYEKFTYGHPEMSSGANQAAMFPTWFRLLTIAYLGKYLCFNLPLTITKCPGYEF